MTRPPQSADSLATLPTAAELSAAADRIHPYAVRTPLVRFDDVLSVKPESLQPVGSFKLRGAFNRVLALPEEVRARGGVVAHSSGNHAQAVAYVGHVLGVSAVVVMPSNAPDMKVMATRRWGAEIVMVGPASDDRVARCAEIAVERGLTVVEPYDDPCVVAGQGTIGSEIAADQPDIDLVLVPVSGGGLLAGVATALKLARPSCRVVAVEPELADDTWQSFQSGARIGITAEEASRTVADGLRVQRLGDLGWSALRQHVDDVVRVSEDEIFHAMRALAAESRVLAEPSGAVATAAWLHHRRVVDPEGSVRAAVAIVSGGNAAHRVSLLG